MENGVFSENNLRDALDSATALDSRTHDDRELAFYMNTTKWDIYNSLYKLFSKNAHHFGAFIKFIKIFLFKKVDRG